MKGSEIASRIRGFCYCGAGAPVPETSPRGFATGTPGVIPGMILGKEDIVVLSQGTGQLVRFAGRNIAIGSVVYHSSTGKTQVVLQGDPEQQTKSRFSLIKWR